MATQSTGTAATGTGAFEGHCFGIEISAHIWVLELHGTLRLPTTARVVILREHVPQGINPDILLLDAIPLGEEGTTDVISPHPVGYLKMGHGRLQIETVDLLYGGEVVASVRVERRR